MHIAQVYSQVITGLMAKKALQKNAEQKQRAKKVL
jgi:hypothetical protein